MDTEAFKPILAGIVRHGLTALGGALVTGGYMQSSDAAGFVGAGMMLAGIAWSWWQKTGQDKFVAMLAKMHAVAAPSATTGEAVKAAKEAVKNSSAVLIAIVLAGALMLPGGAHAEGLKIRAPVARSAVTIDPLSKLMDDVSKVKADIVTGAVGALNEADADAATLTNPSDPTSFRDPISHACYPAQVKFLQSLPQVQPIQAKAPYNLIVLFQRKRDLIAQIKAGLPSYLKLGCAAMLGDEANTFIQTLNMVGISVSAAALTGIIPAAAPITLPALTLPLS